jgi:hypothetical protein
MLARSFPAIPLIRCFGGIDPPGIGAVVRGLAAAVKRRGLSVEDAIRFMQETSEGRLAAPRAWLPAVRGLVGGLRSGMIDSKGLLRFAGYALGRHHAFAGGILCRATGTIAGVRKTLVLRTSPAAASDTLASMAGSTGACVAAFAWLMLRKAFAPGVHYPHEVAPEEVYEAFNGVGVPANKLLDDVIER